MQNYYYVEPFKEQEVNLYLKGDSTFIFQDLTGCNQFEFTGRYKQINDSTVSYLLFSSVKLQNVLPNSNNDLIFSVQDGDTAWIINRDRIFIHKQPFIATSKSTINLQEIRYKKLEEYYIGLLGKEGFLRVFGDGSKKEAKKRLLDCKLPDIKIR
ncbi:hypothetical protein [Chitinophaga sancti]|uniref:Uncharacterized protein n=1 Tax=Chitinophaga sancti TaxID=1004 RepID=A0A1K1SCK0_9BACT|nr:hypothetical protein [Chitinophaga sancti]WQD63598.1 hypothetical protein U0033_04265 [Chitinophaga sancti]WQG90776.1 hypothetical protein SR876_04650 [Chitinophaga sancti]SFW81962.1 hypothetical protein SAMN05661012_05171 [Chitinophaga sancti]